MRTSVSERAQHKRPGGLKRDKRHRRGCFMSVYATLCTCWTDWTRDVDPGLANSRSAFVDGRPVRLLVSRVANRLGTAFRCPDGTRAHEPFAAAHVACAV